MRLTNAGNLGIGTTTPTEVLSVNGNVSIEGTNCRDSGGSATCNNFVDIAELFQSSEPVDSGDVVVIDFVDNSMTSAKNPPIPLTEQTSTNLVEQPPSHKSTAAFPPFKLPIHSQILPESDT